MTCCVNIHRRRTHKRTELSQGPIMGTWDYKWPLDSVVRVAFQAPPETCNVSRADFYAARREVKALAKTWLHGSTARIQLRFVDKVFASPEQKDIAGVCYSHPQHRSPVAETDRVKYDVLVSLEGLPITIFDTLGEAEEKTIPLPYSELGTFARRINYGTPTMFLGPIKKVESLAQYYQKDRLARHMVVHEFGHALGLAHEHQSPVARRELGLEGRKLQVARHEVARHIGLSEDLFDEPFIESNVTREWPGNEHFSDWRHYTAPNAKLDSVMAVPYLQCVNKHCSDDTDKFLSKLIQAPTDSDRAFLSQIYT